MELEIRLKFIYHKNRKKLFLADYHSDISCGNYLDLFALNDFDKASHAQKVLNEEFEAAMMRANERLLTDGFGEQGFQLPRAETGDEGDAQ